MTEDKEIRDTPLGLRIKRSLRDAIKRAAEDDNRTMASMAEVLIQEGLHRRGYLPKS